MKPKPILFVSDSPAIPSGLGRITKDLAVQASRIAGLRVGTFGAGNVTSSKLPFVQYGYPSNTAWGSNLIEDVWSDFAGADTGIIFVIGDLSRFHWLSRPRMGGELQRFLQSGRFKKVAYVPIDGYGIGGTMTGICADALRGFDTVLACSVFGQSVMEQTLGRQVDFIPHGINEKPFQRRDPAPGRAMIGANEHDVIVGMVATNQSRKDWGTAFGAIARAKNQIPNLRFWVHTDTDLNSWNIPALIEDFGLTGSVIVTYTGQFSSEQLSYIYSACSMTILLSLGEGFGYPIAESLACGVPVMHPNWAAGAELIPNSNWLTQPVGTRLEGPWNIVRPVLDPIDCGGRIVAMIEQAADGSQVDVCTNAIQHLYYDALWPSCWAKLFESLL